MEMKILFHINIVSKYVVLFSFSRILIVLQINLKKLYNVIK